jgi:hypothetical protein
VGIGMAHSLHAGREIVTGVEGDVFHTESQRHRETLKAC